jgi:hypothetical protein
LNEHRQAINRYRYINNESIHELKESGLE